MKILFVLEYYYPHTGGVETLFKQLAEGLAKDKNNEITVITSRPKNQKIKTDKINEVNIYWVSTPNRYLFTLLSFFQIASLAKNYDLIHTTTYNAAFPAWLAAKIYRKKILITVHEIFDELWFKFKGMSYFSKSLHAFYEKIILLLPFDQFICVSEYTKKCLTKLKKNEKNISVIYNGIDYNHWDASKYDGNKIRNELGLQNNFVYLYYGRPGISKGIENLIEAVSKINKQILNSKLLLLLGKNPLAEYKKIVKTVEKKGLNDKVILRESVSYEELPNYIKSANCVVIPSLSEGFGFSVAETSAIGTPILATSAGAIPEVISGKYILISETNPKNICDGILGIYNKKYIQKSLKKFTNQETVNKYFSIYNNLVT